MAAIHAPNSTRPPAAAMAAEVRSAGTRRRPDTYYVNDGVGITTVGASASNYNAHLDHAGTTLHLKNLRVLEPSSTMGSYNYVIYGNQVDLMTLVLEGDNAIRTEVSGSAYKTAAIYIDQGSLAIEGSGQLIATGTDKHREFSCGIYIREGNLTVKSGTVIATGGNTTASAQGLVPEGSYGAYAKWAVHVTGGTLQGYGGVSSITSRGVSTGPHGHGPADSCDVTVSGGGVLEGHGGATSKTSYGVYADYLVDAGNGRMIGTGGIAAQESYGVYTKGATTVSGTLSGTADTVGSNGEPGISYGVYSGGAVTVTGALTGTGGKVELGTGNGYTATSMGVQCGGEVSVSNGSLTGTGGAAVAITNDAVSIGVNANSGLNVTGNNGSVTGMGGACLKISGTGGAYSYGVRCDGSVVVGSSSTAEASLLSGTGGTASDTSGNDISRSFGVCGRASSGTFTVNKGATLTGIGGDAFASRGVSANTNCTVKGTLEGTGNAFANGISSGVIVDTANGHIDLSGSMTARANGGDVGNASASIGVSASGGIHMTGQGYLLASTSAAMTDNHHSAKGIRDGGGQNVLTAEDTAVWRETAGGDYQPIATYRANDNEADKTSRQRLEVKNAGHGLAAAPGRRDIAARTQGSGLPDEKAFTVENTSGVALTLSADALTDYTVTLPQTSLAAGESMQITARPNTAALNATGNHAATLTLRGAPGDALAEIPLSFQVNAAPTVALYVSPSMVDSGEEVVLTARMTTPGTTPYQEYEWTIMPASGGTTTQTTGGTVNTLAVYPTERTTYRVRVKDACGVYATSGNKRVDIKTYTISVNPALLAFGVVREGYTPPAAQTVTVRNTGTETLLLNPLSSTNFVATAFGTSTLTPGNVTTFTLQPKPGLTVGERGETLTITTTAGGSATLPVSFSVVGAVPSIVMRPNTTYPMGQSGGHYEVVIGAGTPAAALGAADLGSLTVRRADGVDFSPALGTDYGKRDGSIIITLYEAYLNRLPAGEYTLTANVASGVYAGQTPSLVFRVADAPKPPKPPKTGDSAQPLLWLALICLAGAGLAVFAAKKRGARAR